MEVLRSLEVTTIPEIKILSNVRLIGRHDLNPLKSSDNLSVQFTLTGDFKGSVTCYLCLDGHELTEMERNYVFPLFTEAMNILIGKQLSTESLFSGARVNLSAPKLSMIPVKLDTSRKTATHRYELELTTISFTVLVNFSLETVN